MATSVSEKNSTNVRAEGERDPGFTAAAEEVASALGSRRRPPAVHQKARGPVVPWYIRAGFSTLGTLAPPLASAWAEQLFLTPARHPVPDEEDTALAEAHAGSLQVNGQRLATWTWGRGPTVLLVHGWAGRGGQLFRFVPGLLARGYSVVTFDGPGHGASEGRRSSLVEHSAAVRAIADALPSPVHAVVSHSMGGAATAFAMSRGLHLSRAVFLAPPYAASGWAETFSRAFGLSDAVRDGMRARVEGRLHVPFDELDMARVAPGMHTPLLVIHDTEDKEVPWRDGAALVGHWPGARLHSTTGLGHKRILGDATVIAQAVAFVAETD